MVTGIGTDIVENARFLNREERFLKKIFTAYELEVLEKRANKSEYLASRFAAKEAVSKALGSGFSGLSPLDIEIREDEKGKPYVLLSQPREEKLFLSISHEKDYSIAMAVAER